MWFNFPPTLSLLILSSLGLQRIFFSRWFNDMHVLGRMWGQDACVQRAVTKTGEHFQPQIFKLSINIQQLCSFDDYGVIVEHVYSVHSSNQGRKDTLCLLIATLCLDTSTLQIFVSSGYPSGCCYDFGTCDVGTCYSASIPSKSLSKSFHLKLSLVSK